MVLPLSLKPGLKVSPLLHLSTLCPVLAVSSFARSFMFLLPNSGSGLRGFPVGESCSPSSGSFCFQTLSLQIFQQAIYRAVLLSHIYVLPLPQNLYHWPLPIKSSQTFFLHIENLPALI